MALELKQSLKLTQKLVMTPQLRQAIKLLQLGRLELSDTLRAEMEQNPMLEEVPSLKEEGGHPEALSATEEHQAAEIPITTQVGGDGPANIGEVNWDDTPTILMPIFPLPGKRRLRTRLPSLILSPPLQA